MPRADFLEAISSALGGTLASTGVPDLSWIAMFILVKGKRQTAFCCKNYYHLCELQLLLNQFVRYENSRVWVCVPPEVLHIVPRRYLMNDTRSSITQVQYILMYFNGQVPINLDILYEGSSVSSVAFKKCPCQSLYRMTRYF